MSETCDISFVIPVYNEEHSLPELVKRIDASVIPSGKTAEIMFVNDGSTDGSLRVIRELKQSHTVPLRVITLRKNFGKSAALFAGVEKSRGDVIVTIDADLQNDPADLPKFLAEIENGADMVCGWRVDRQDPLEKTLPSRFFNNVTSRMSGLDIHDFNCGFKAYRREVLKEVAFYGDMHRFMPFLAHKRGFKVAEVPILHHPRLHDSSKYRFERYYRGGLDLLTVMFITSYLVRPMHLFGTIGSLLMLMGGGVFSYLFFGRWIWGQSVGTSPLLSVSFLLIGVGVQVFMTGFLAELMVHWRKVQQPEFSIKSEED
ncbi:MAG: glycosyltransferase family 2 protein [SAR324 cluster bacterium]|nr:glycosyltransferase family 2 protein [SAR324 cluster bacterium]MBF0350175.1 glycosyltransferase family 2 protein [SAR324 cluster bacterium]